MIVVVDVIMLWPVVTRESGRGQQELRELSSRADWYYYHHHFPELHIQSPKSPKDNHLYLGQKINVVCPLINFVLVYVGCLWHVGFHLMLKGESPRNIFRIWMAWKWNRNKLRVPIHSCTEMKPITQTNEVPELHTNTYFIFQCAQFVDNGKIVK